MNLYRIKSTRSAVIYHQDVFPGVVELAFPGYARSGLMKLVLNAEQQVWKEEDLI
jgi:hypothetical protein